ncbi:hypothetical protein, partial [Pseudomonas guariconensis]|uniref:hypothetical protein n=1 Tax=Pseudomonas guariconensis TaxID=1288410 RepID=UPI003AF3228E
STLAKNHDGHPLSPQGAFGWFSYTTSRDTIPNSDETYLKIPTDTSEKVEIKVPRALATAAFNAAQIANGSPIAPNEKIVIHTYFDGLTHTARQIYIGPI